MSLSIGREAIEVIDQEDKINDDQEKKLSILICWPRGNRRDRSERE